MDSVPTVVGREHSLDHSTFYEMVSIFFIELNASIYGSCEIFLLYIVYVLHV